MAGNEGMSGQGKKEAAETAGGAGAGHAASEWLETKPFLSGGEEPPLTPRVLGGGEKVKEGAARALGHAAKAPQGRLGKLGALLAANGFLAGAAIFLSVVAFGVTGVALLNSTSKTIDDDDVATVGLGGDKDPDGSTTTTVVRRPGAAGETSSKTTQPSETTTTTTRPTATTRPVVPPPTDPPVTEPPTVPPTEPPPPAPGIFRFARSYGDYCRDQTRAVNFSWSSRDGDSASLTDPRGVVVASGLPADGSHTIGCVPSGGTTTGAVRGTWTLTITGPGGSVTDTESVN